VLAGPSLQFQSSVLLAACLGGGNPLVATDPSGDPGLLARLGSVPDPRDRQGRRYGLATLLALGVCAMSAAGHDSVVAIAQWGRSAGGQVLARLGAPFDPLRGVYQVPGRSRTACTGSATSPSQKTHTNCAPVTAPAVLAGLRDIVRGALHKTGWANIAAGRRAHLDPISVLALHGIP